MGEVSDEARDIAVKWCEDNNYDWILDKVKLASDLENYARWYFHQQMVANNHKFAIKGENMREGTQYVQVNITSKHDGNDSSSTRQEVTRIFVGDGKTIKEKKALLWKRVQEYIATWYDVGFETIYAD